MQSKYMFKEGQNKKEDYDTMVGLLDKLVQAREENSAVTRGVAEIIEELGIDAEKLT